MPIQNPRNSLTYLLPDTGIINASKANLNTLYVNCNGLYLAVLQEQLNTLKKQQRALDDSLRDMLVTVPAELQIDNIRRLIQAIRSTPHDQNLYAAEINDIIASTLEIVGDKAVALSRQLDTLNTSGLSDVSRYIQSNEQLIATQQTACEGLENAIAENAAQKEVLSTAMRITEDKTLWDEWRPLVQGLATLDPRSPAVSAIQAAVIGVTTILGIASESVTYGKLLEARKKLQSHLDAQHQDIELCKKNINILTRQAAQLADAQAIEQPKADYEREVGKVVATLTSFVSTQGSAEGLDPLEYARTFALESEALSRYLQNILEALR